MKEKYLKTNELLKSLLLDLKMYIRRREEKETNLHVLFFFSPLHYVEWMIFGARTTFFSLRRLSLSFCIFFVTLFLANTFDSPILEHKMKWLPFK